jgi:hypothetical protein
MFANFGLLRLKIGPLLPNTFLIIHLYTHTLDHKSSLLLFIIVTLLLHFMYPNLPVFLCVYSHNADPVFAVYV